MTPEEKEQRRNEILERDKRWRDLFDKILDVMVNKDLEAKDKLIAEMRSLDPEYCEHGRHKYAVSCMGCDALDRELFPENYEKCSKCEETVFRDELRDGCCLDCYGG